MMEHAIHSAIRESIHSVICFCINRLLRFVNQNKIKGVLGGQCGRIQVLEPALLVTDAHLTRENFLDQWVLNIWQANGPEAC